MDGVDEGDCHLVGDLIGADAFVGVYGLVVPIVLEIVFVEFWVSEVDELPGVVGVEDELCVAVVGVEGVEDWAGVGRIGHCDNVLRSGERR